MLIRLVWVAFVVLGTALSVRSEPATDGAGFFYGHITSSGTAVKGAMVTFYHGDPLHSLTVFTDDQGRFLSPELPWPDGYRIRVRRVGWHLRARHPRWEGAGWRWTCSAWMIRHR